MPTQNSNTMTDINLNVNIGVTDDLREILRGISSGLASLKGMKTEPTQKMAEEATSVMPEGTTPPVTVAPVAPAEEVKEQEITDADLLAFTSATMQIFSGKADTRNADDPLSKDVAKQCGRIFKEISMHYGYPRPTRLPQAERAKFLKDLDMIMNEGTKDKPVLKWIPY